MLSRVRRFFQVAEPEDADVLLRGAAALICIGFVVWLVFSWTNYADKYSQVMEGWRLGGTHMVELTLVREDRDNLSCASDQEFADVRCGFRANKSPREPKPEEKLELRPYKSVKGELILGAGLWSGPDLAQPPRGRFTAVCNYTILGVTKSANVRWQKSGQFSRLSETVPVGRLDGCVIPR